MNRLKGGTVLIFVFALQRKNSSAFEENIENNVGKSTVRASNAATNTHTRPTSCLKVPDVLSLSFSVFMFCTRVRGVLRIGSPGVYTGRIVLVQPRSSSLHRQIATLHIAIACRSKCKGSWPVFPGRTVQVVVFFSGRR